MHIDLVIDADGHCNEPWEDLTPWMPKDYHHRAPVGFSDRHGTSRMYVEGRLSTRTEGLGQGVEVPSPRTSWRPARRCASPRSGWRTWTRRGSTSPSSSGPSIALTVNGSRTRGWPAICHAVNLLAARGYLPPTEAAEGRRPHPLPGPAGGGQRARATHPLGKTAVSAAMLPEQRVRHQPRRPPLRPDLRGGPGPGHAAVGPPQTGHDGQYGVSGVMGAGSERMEKYSYVHMTAFRSS